MHVVVIGAGIMGVSTAHFLQTHSIDVTVVERESAPAEGASYGNGGYLQSSVPDPWNAPGAFSMFVNAWSNYLTGRGDRSAFSVVTMAIPGLLSWGLEFLSNSDEKTFLNSLAINRDLAQYTKEVLGALSESEQLNYSQSAKGSLVIFRDMASMAAYETLVSKTESSGTKRTLLDPGQLIATESSLASIAPELVGAVHLTDDHSGNSHQYCQGLEAITRERGAQYYYNTQVQKICPVSQKIELQLDAGKLMADAVVVAAGVHSKPLVKPLGIRLPVVPAKGYSISIPMTHWEKRPKHVIVDMGIHAGLNPLGENLRVAGTAEFCGLRRGTSSKRIEYLIDLARQILPDMQKIDIKDIDPWSGFRPLTTDGLPIIGETGVKNVYLITGHGGLGWTQGTGSAKALADKIAGVQSEFELEKYSLGRFR